MNIIAVDDEPGALRALERAIAATTPKARLACFDESTKALGHARENTVDVAFLDIRMGGMNGLVLAKKLKELRGGTNIIFVTGYSDYMLPAFNMHASGYVMKPVEAAKVAHELNNLREPVHAPDKGIRVQCFGHFEVFVDGAAVPFGRAKAKELLAYLVDRRGAGVTNKDLAAILWEDEAYDRSKQKQLQVYIAEMMRCLAAAGAGEIIVSKRGVHAVDTARFACDFYQYIKGDAAAVNAYRGEYMANYSWAEFTTGLLEVN